MPAQSKAQQRFMGMVHAAQKGELENPSPEVAKVAKDMSDKDAKDYASTSHKGLPNRVKQEILNRLKEYALTLPNHNIKPAAPAQSLEDLEGVEESVITEKQFKGLEGIPPTTSLEKITKDQKLKIIKAPGNIIDFIVPKGVSRNFWQVIGTGKVKKNLAGEFYLEGKVINSPMFKSLDALIDGVKWKSMEERRRFNEGVNESWTVKDGSVLSNGKLIGYYDFDRDSDSFWVDDVKKGKGQLSFDTKKEVEDYFKKNEKDAIKHLGKLREGKELKWQDVEVGDAANVKAINKTGLIIKTYGRKFHLKFPNGSTKTYDANELTFVKNESVNESTNPREEALLKTFKNIVDTHSSLKVKDGGKTTLVDVQSANAVLKIYDNLSDTNKKSLLKMPLDKIIKTAWHILGKL